MFTWHNKSRQLKLKDMVTKVKMTKMLFRSKYEISRWTGKILWLPCPYKLLSVFRTFLTSTSVICSMTWIDKASSLNVIFTWYKSRQLKLKDIVTKVKMTKMLFGGKYEMSSWNGNTPE
jgi:hypothetical protein